VDGPKRMVGKYELLQELGRGATAKVYLARHSETGESVCLKIFHESFASGNRALERIRRETTLASSLNHENVVRVIEILPEDPPVLVMQFIDGHNLEKIQPRLPYILPEVSVLIAIEIAKGLEHAHEHGIIHRDLKPENILVSEKGKVYVSDFGLAKIKDGITVTETQALVGSLDYLSPEQATGDRLTSASDLFSLGSILYFLTTGTRPFAKESIVATLGAIRLEDPDAPQSRNPKMSAELSRIILKTLNKKTEDRYVDVRSFRAALEDYLRRLGLGPEHFNLPHWFEEFTSMTMEALQRSADQLVERCEQSLKKQEQRTFIEDLSHLSAKAPASAALRRLTESYDRFHTRAQVKKRVLWVAAGLLLVVIFGLSGYGYKHWTSNRIGTAAETTPVIIPPKVAEVIPAPSPLKKKVLVTRPGVKPEPKVVEAKPEAQDVAASAEEVAETETSQTYAGVVQFNVPKDSEVYWDHNRINAKAPLINQRPGKHLLIINRPGYDLVRTTINVKETEPTKVTLHE
jgi:serine/threonine protein kinase